MRISQLSACVLALLASSSSVSALSTIPQITDYSIPSFAFTMVSWTSGWSSLKNIDSFKAQDVSIGLEVAYAIDTSYNVWSYNSSLKAWAEVGITAKKFAAIGFLDSSYVYVDKTTGEPKNVLMGTAVTATDTSMATAMTTQSITSIVDITVTQVTMVASIIDDAGLIWSWDSSTSVWTEQTNTKTSTAIAIAVDFSGVLWIVDDSGDVYYQSDSDFVAAGSDVGATDISVGIDGSVWVTRVDPTNKKATSETAQYVAKSDSFVSFGQSGTAIAAFDFIYAGVVDTDSSSSNVNLVQTMDCLGLNSVITSLLSSYASSLTS